MTARSDCRKYIRPLLTTGKDAIRSYLEGNNYRWFEDASNAEKKYTRNKVRLDLIPLLEELVGGKTVLQR